jgi:malonyl CoA-acyl carrier protein transacylase
MVYARAMAMQKACEANPSTMAANLNLEDEVVEKVCAENEVVVENDVLNISSYTPNLNNTTFISVIYVE